MVTRKGPYPLSWHLGMAGTVPNGSGVGEATFQRMIEGIQRYQNSKRSLDKHPYEMEWGEGESRLLEYAAAGARKDDQYMSGKAHKPRTYPQTTTCFLVPSLINGPDIFDLCAKQSFIRFLGRENITAAVLDWGNLYEETRPLSIENLITRRLIPAAEYFVQKTGQKLNILGYCMGGNLAIALSVLRPDLVQTLTLLAVPWDFQDGLPAIYNRIKSSTPFISDLIEKEGGIPASVLHAFFSSLDPAMIQNKFSSFVDMQAGGRDEMVFIAVEDWLNGGKKLPETIARECIENWFLGNSMMKKTWTIDGKGIRLEDINVPALIIASAKDRLIDYKNADIFSKSISNAHVISPGCGHIGMMAGADSQNQVWEPLSQWIVQQSEATV